MSSEFHHLDITSVEQLTKDAVAISLRIPESLTEKYQYTQGQYLTFKAEIDGKDIRRSYSICSSVQEQKLTVGIKRIDGGVFSNKANEDFAKGLKLEVLPPQGHFYTELRGDNKKNYLLLAVGSGITPNLSHLQSILQTEPNSTVTLIYGNKSTPLMMFRDKLCHLKNAYLTRFRWINLFTLEEHEAELFNGRINGEKLLALHNAKVIDINSFDDVFICGPEEMTINVEEFLKIQHFTKDSIHYELFFSGSAEKKTQKSKSARAEKYAGKVATVAVNVAGRKTVIQLPMGGVDILDAVMENGADLPFSCKGGVCATCKAKIIAGKVEMDMNHSLTEQEVSDGFILTCQAHPVSTKVEIDFDFS